MAVRMEDIEDLYLNFTFPVYGESVHFTKNFAEVVLEHFNQRFITLTRTPALTHHISFDTFTFGFRGLHPVVQAMGAERFLSELGEFAMTLGETVLTGSPDIPRTADFVGFTQHGFEVSIVDEVMLRTWFTGVVGRDWVVFDGPAPMGQGMTTRQFPMVRRPSIENVEPATVSLPLIAA